MSVIRASRKHRFQACACVDAQLGDKGADGHDYQLGCCFDLFAADDFCSLGTGKDAQDQGIKDGKQDEPACTQGNINLTDGIGNDNEDEGQHIDLPLAAKPFAR